MKDYQKLDLDDIKKKRFMLATPMYDGVARVGYIQSLINLTKICVANNIEYEHFFLGNESLITRARNYCVDSFLRSSCTHLVFVDADISFNPLDLLFMIYFVDGLDVKDSQYHVMSGAYPKKGISWEKIKKAVDSGLADENPNILEKYVGDYAFNLMPGVKSFNALEIIQIRHAATGFLCVHRSVFEKYIEKYPDKAYTPDHTRMEHFDGSRKIHCFFDTEIDDETDRYLSEDYMFSKYVNKMGVKTWLCPWFKLDHTGTYVFKGDLISVLQSGSVHSDLEKNKK